MVDSYIIEHQSKLHAAVLVGPFGAVRLRAKFVPEILGVVSVLLERESAVRARHQSVYPVATRDSRAHSSRAPEHETLTVLSFTLHRGYLCMPRQGSRLKVKTTTASASFTVPRLTLGPELGGGPFSPREFG